MVNSVTQAGEPGFQSPCKKNECGSVITLEAPGRGRMEPEGGRLKSQATANLEHQRVKQGHLSKILRSLSCLQSQGQATWGNTIRITIGSSNQKETHLYPVSCYFVGSFFYPSPSFIHPFNLLTVDRREQRTEERKKKKIRLLPAD